MPSTGRRSARTVVVGLVLLGVVLVGCTAAASQAAGPAPPSEQAAALHAHEPSAATRSDDAAGRGAAARVPARPALVLLAADVMRARVRADEDFAQAANAALNRNTDAVAQLAGPLLGEAGHRTVPVAVDGRTSARWSTTRAASPRTTPPCGTGSRASLVELEAGLAEVFASASGGRLDQGAAQALIVGHVDHLLGQADAYAAQDYSRSVVLYRTGYSHAFDLGRALAGVLLPPDQVAVLDTPTWRLRAGAQQAARRARRAGGRCASRGVADQPDFAAATARTGPEHRRSRPRAVDSIFGPEAATQFMSRWADHIDRLVDYTAGIAAEDEGRRAAAVAGLRAVEGRLAAFLDTATGSTLASSDLAHALLLHDEMLLRQVDAFAARDFPRAHDLAYDTYTAMTDLARQLSDAFGESVATRTPQGGARTGRGGTAGPAADVVTCGPHPRGAESGRVPGGDRGDDGAAGGRVAGRRRSGAHRTPSEQAPVQAFRSVRTYPEVALPVRPADPGGAGGHPARAARPGPATGRSRCRRTPTWRAGSAKGPGPDSRDRPCVLGHVDSERAPAVFFHLRASSPWGRR